MQQNKELLRENFARDWNNNVLPMVKFKLSEKKIVEAEGNEYRVDEGYEVPIWVLDKKNLNERIYSRKLGEKLVKEAKKTFSLKDHPEDEGSVDRIVAVAENPHIVEANYTSNTSTDSLLCVNVFFVDDEFEKKVERIVDRGMGIGVSSSGYGEVSKDGSIDESTYDLERYLDFVLDPSYQVYLSKDFNNKMNEKVEQKSEIVTNEVDTITINESDKKEKPVMADTKEKKLSIEEKNLRMGVKSLMEKASRVEGLDEKRDVYTEILEYCDGVEFAESFVNEANEAIKTIDIQIKELAKKGKDFDKVSESHSKVSEEKAKLEKSFKEKDKQYEKTLTVQTEKFDIACNLLDDMKDREEQLKEMYEVAVGEKNGMVSASEYKELFYYAEKKDEEIDELKENLRNLKRELFLEKKKKYKKEDEDEDQEENLDNFGKKKAKPFKKKKDEEEDEVLDEEEKDDDDDDKEDKEDKEEAGKKKKKKEAVDKDEYLFNQANPDVVDYYTDLLYENRNVEVFKEKILSCRTLFEAQRMFLKLKDLIENVNVPQRDKSSMYETLKSRPNARIDRREKLQRGKAELPGVIGTALKNRKGWL